MGINIEPSYVPFGVFDKLQRLICVQDVQGKLFVLWEIANRELLAGTSA